MTKEDIVKEVSGKNDITKGTAVSIVEILLDTLKNALVR